MDKKKLVEFLECNEPIFEYNNREYGICNLGDKYCFGESFTDEKDVYFETLEDLVDELVIDGKHFYEIAREVLSEYLVDKN